jgi:hypothetical protein
MSNGELSRAPWLCAKLYSDGLVSTPRHKLLRYSKELARRPRRMLASLFILEYGTGPANL